MPDPVTLAIVGSQLIGAFGSNSKAKKAARANRRANELELKRRRIQNVLARRKSEAERRRIQAAVAVQAVANSAGTSSAAEAARSSVESQAATDITTQSQLEGIDVARGQQISRAQKATTQANNISQGAGVVGSVIGAFGES